MVDEGCKLDKMIKLIENDDFFDHWDVVADKETLKNLPLEHWLKIIKQRPKWWIFRGPFSDECYNDQHRETLILFLMNNPDIADIYFSSATPPSMYFSIAKRCKNVQDILFQDPRIAALVMMLI